MMMSLLILLLLSFLCISLSYNNIVRLSFIKHKQYQCLYSTPSDDAVVQSAIKLKLNSDMKEAMKAKDKERLAGIRAITTAVKQKEVDERVVVDDEMTIVIMTKLIKQRKGHIYHQ